jgi:hypothetical protein
MTSLAEAFSGRSLRSHDEFIDPYRVVVTETISEPNQVHPRVFPINLPNVPAEVIQPMVLINNTQPPLPNNVNISPEDQKKITEKYQINDSELKSSIVTLKKNYSEICMKRNSSLREKQDIEENLNLKNRKIKELIDLTDDKSLIEVLTTKMNEVSPRLQEINESLETMDKEYFVLKEQYESLTEIFPKNVCGICYTNENNAFITNCGHSFCYDCCCKLSKCATCRIQINSSCIKKIYYN